MQVFLIFLQQEFILAGQNFAKILQNFLFFFIALAVFLLTTQENSNASDQLQLLISAILFCLIFSSIFSNSDFMREDFEDGTLEQITIFQQNLEIFILTKIIASWIIFSLPILLIIPLIFLALGLDHPFNLSFLTTILLTSLIMNFICSFCGSLGMVKNKAPLIAIIAMPLAIPTMLIAHLSMINILTQSDYNSALKILMGMCVLSGAISILFTAKITKILLD